MTEQVYTADDWPHGLRCMDCDRPFVEGQPISQRLVSVGDETVTLELVCVGCALVPEQKP